MGEAKRRRAEIELLKSLPPEEAARWQQSKQDEKTLLTGIDPEATDPTLAAAMTRQIYYLVEKAKRTKNIDETIAYLYSRVDATIRGLSDIPIACGSGCSHCCYIWVSVTAPEAIYLSKLIAKMGTEAVDRVRKAHETTKHFEFDLRDQHPHPCPMLKNNLCEIYSNRPKSCRQAASGDANVCARSYHNLTDEGIPTPAMYMQSRVNYAAALWTALKKANLRNNSYEFSAAIVRALDTPDAEESWLSGKDIFAGVLGERVEPKEFVEAQQFLLTFAFAEK